MKLLIISNTPWRNDNSFGNTFSNILGDHYEIANVYLQSGTPNTDTCKINFQISEIDLLKNLINKRHKTGKIVESEKTINPVDSKDKKNNFQKLAYNIVKKYRFKIFWWANEFIWKIGRWKTKELYDFVTEFKPDVLFFPIYDFVYINRVQSYVLKIAHCPMLSYISDDHYTLKQFSLSPFFWIDKLVKRKYVKSTIMNSEIIYVISQKQKEEYENIFKKKFKLLYKGSDFSVAPQIKEKLNSPLKLVFTGNIGDGRWKTLSKIGKALENINRVEIKAQLFIYTLTPMTNQMKKSLNIEDSIILMGGIPSSKVLEVQRDADILVHCESFKLEEKLKVRLSFSTKIVDYLSSARCIFAIGSDEVASIDYLIKNDCAIVARSENDIESKLNEIIENPNLIKEYEKKSFECGKKNHQIDIIQKNLYNDFVKISGRESE